MAQEEIIAVFKADIEQFKTQMAELGIKVEAVQTKVEGVSGSTEKFSKHSKSAGTAISGLSKGLGGVAGLLGITGRLFGVNTDKLEGLVFASREFIKVSRDITHAQHLSTAATEAGTVAKTENEAATVSLTIAQRVLNAVMSGGVGIVLAIGAALTAGIGILIGYNKAQEERKRVQEDLNRIERESLDIFLESQKKRRDANDLVFKNNLQRKVNNKEINESQQKQQELDLEYRKQTIHNNLLLKSDLEDLAKRRKRDHLSEETFFNEKLKFQNNFINRDLAIQEDYKSKSETISIEADKTSSDNQEKANEKATSEREKKQKEELADLIEFQNDKLKVNTDYYEKKLQKELDDLEKSANERIKKANEFRDMQEDLERENANNFIKNADKENKKNADIAEKERLEKIQAEKQALDIIVKAQQEAFDKRQELLNKEIDQQDKNVTRQEELAQRGLDNTLAFEERRQAELARQQQKEVERQRKIKLLETFLNSLAEYSKTDPDKALQKALLEVALAQAAMAVFAEEGGIIGEITERSMGGRRRHKGGGDVLLHAQTGEGILSRDEMSNLGRRNFHLLKDAARFPIRDDIFGMPKIAMNGGMQISNAEVVKELKALQHIVKNKRETTYDLNQFGEYTRTQIENGLTTVRKGKLKKPRL